MSIHHFSVNLIQFFFFKQASPRSSEQNNPAGRSTRRQKVRRRKVRVPRQRPWSYHASELNDGSWDYYPFSLVSNHEQNNEDVFDTDQVRSLIEFGDNYEAWIKPEGDIFGDINDGGSFSEYSQTKINFCFFPDHPNVQESNHEEQLDSLPPLDMSIVNKVNSVAIPSYKDASTSPIPFFVEEPVEEERTARKQIETRSTHTQFDPVQTMDSGCMTESPTLLRPAKKLVINCCSNCRLEVAQEPTKTIVSHKYFSFKFCATFALAGILAFFYAVSHFSPEMIEKSYPRPPPL